MRRESRMFSSGSQVLYLPGRVGETGAKGVSPPSTPIEPLPDPIMHPPHPLGKGGGGWGGGGAAPLHSLDGPALPFHQVLDAPLKNTGKEEGGGGVKKKKNNKKNERWGGG